MLGGSLLKFKKLRFHRVFLILLVAAAASVLCPSSVAGRGLVRDSQFPDYTADPDLIEAPSGIVVDINTGAVLFEKNALKQYGPASLSKIATLTVAYQELDEGKVDSDDVVTVSERAWAANPNLAGSSLMFLEVDDEVSFSRLLEGLIIPSGNDAAIALAEHMHGSEQNTVRRMNQLADRLNMRDTRFATVHGLPAGQKQQTTARDIAKLTRHLCLHYPQALEITSQRSFQYGQVQTQYNRNNLLERDPRVVGLKTGWTSGSGYHLVGVAQDNGEFYAAVVMGIGAGDEDMSPQVGFQTREDDAHALLDWAFDVFAQQQVDSEDLEPTGVPVFKGDKRQIDLHIGEDIPSITVPEGTEDRLQYIVFVDKPLEAPLHADAPVGWVAVKWQTEDEDNPLELERWDLYPREDIGRGGWWRVVWDSIVLFFRELSADN